MSEVMAILIIAACSLAGFILQLINLFVLLGVLDHLERRNLRGKEASIKIMYIVKDDNPDVGYAIEVGEVTDSEGNVIPDAQLQVEVASDNSASVEVVPGEDPKAGTIHFGAPGNANVTATVKDGNGNVLGTGAASFLVTTGDPAAITGVSLKFDGLTES